MKKLYGLFKNIYYCLALSLHVSVFYTVVRFVSRILIALFPLGLTWCTKYLIDVLSGGAEHAVMLRGILWGIAGYGILSVMNVLMQKWNTYVTGMHTDRLNHMLEKMMMSRAIRAELDMFDDPEYYDRFQNARRNTYAMGNAVWNVIDMFSTAFAFVGSCWMLCGLNPLAAGIFVALSVPSVWNDYRYTSDLYDLECKNVDNERKRSYLYSIATERAYAQDLRLFGIGNGIRGRYQRLWNQYIHQKSKLVKSHAWKNVMLSLPVELCTIGILVYVSIGIMENRYSLGDFSLYMGAVSQLVSSIYIMITSLVSVWEAQLKIENVRSFQRFTAKKVEEGGKILSEKVEIQFEHVSFRYPGTEKMVLKDVSFVIHPGERIALIGLNGSGKSTIIKLLLRFYDVTEGRILYDGIPIEEYTRSSIRRQFSVLFQDFVNYAFTVEENVQLENALQGRKQKGSDREESTGRYRKVMKQSGMDEILEKLSRKDQTYVSRRFDDTGVEFSRGQYQKLALARALFREGSIVLLDEPSAALDPKAEYEIFQAMDTYCREKTALFITHRLDNVGFADRIFYLELGKLAEAGTEEELLRRGGGYAKLWDIANARRGRQEM
jgi:ATP-binding cassette subfamily B protein